MSSKVSQNVCCKCSAPRTDVDLVSMLDLPGRIEIFKIVAKIEFALDAKSHEVLICQRCVKEVDGAFAFRQKILNFEANYFGPRREKSTKQLELDENTASTFGFDVCRVCLFPSYVVGTKSIFKELGKNGMEYVEIIFHFTDFNMSIDYKMFQGRICVECIEELENFFKIREEMRQANTSHVFLRQTKKSQLEPNSKRSNPTSFQAKPVELAKNPNESKFNCEICGKFLCDKSGLRRHLEARHLKIRKNSCDHCDYSSIQKNQLISHILRKHFYPTINKKSIYDEKRPIPCDYRGCRKRFFTKPELKQHQRSHSDARPFKCSCSAAYKRKSDLKLHQRGMHKQK